MKWMTKREVERAAKKGPLAALNNSIEKWEQMRDASEVELKRKLKRTEDFGCAMYCACCWYTGWRKPCDDLRCHLCPISIHCSSSLLISPL